MAQFKKIFHQDLTKRRIIHHCEDVVFTGDNLSDKIGVYLYDNGEPYAGGGTVSGTVINSRGQTVPITTGEISGNLITVTLEEAALAVPGIIGVYVKLTSGQQIATVLGAMFTAMPTETNQAIDPGTIIPSVSQLITDIQTARNSIPPEYTELLAAVAPTFSASTAYTAGAYVWHGGSLYRFTADHAAGSWTGTDAVQVSLADDLGRQVSDLRSALITKEDLIGTYNKVTITPEAYGYNIVDNRNSSQASFYHLTYQIPSGTKVVGVSGYHATEKQALYGFYDSNNNLLDYEKDSSSAVSYPDMIVVPVPENAAKLIVNIGTYTSRGIYAFTKFDVIEEVTARVSYEEAQELTRTQMETAKHNIEAIDKGNVLYLSDNVFDNLDPDAVPWSEGTALSNNGGTIASSLNATSQYIYARSGSYIHVKDGFSFSVATYTLPAESANTGYRTYGNKDYSIESDCYIRICVRNDDMETAVTEVIAQGAFENVIYAITKAEQVEQDAGKTVGFAIKMESGTINSADGQDSSATNRMRSTTGVLIKPGTTIINSSGISVAWRRYNDAECTDFAGASGDWSIGNISIGNKGYYRFVFQFNNFSNGVLSNYLSIANNDLKANTEKRLSALEYAVKPLSEFPVIYPPSEPYIYNGADITEQFVNGSGDMLTPLYALFDALVTAHPNNIVKSVIGRDESDTYDINCYTIQQVNNMSNVPVILFLADIHASEPYTLTATYAMAKELLENHETDDVLGFVWRNCVLKIVPVCNPWGLANGGQRYNSEGVNLNRDFPVDWEYSSDPYDKTGETPASQAETQAIMAFIESNKSNALFAVNKHDSDYFSDASTNGKLAYSVDNYKIDMNVLRAYYRTLQIAFWKKYRDIFTQNPKCNEYTMLFSNLSQTATHGTMHKWFNYIGVHGCLQEVTRPKTGDGYTENRKQDFIQINLEMSVNMIASALMENRLLITNADQWNAYMLT